MLGGGIGKVIFLSSRLKFLSKFKEQFSVDEMCQIIKLLFL